MPDRFPSFPALSLRATHGRDYRVRLRERPGTTLVLAPHGGGIEPGTSEIAEAVAGDDLSFYAFEGIRSHGNADLHITSTRFDEPRCVALAGDAPLAVAVHGEERPEPFVVVGGRDAAVAERVRAALASSGFAVRSPEGSILKGEDPANICNRTKSGAGVQIEVSRGLRLAFFAGLSRSGREIRTPRFHAFVATVRRAVV
jgi:phage replication-related protein YjqB (UPF0714/DUF867 family)